MLKTKKRNTEILDDPRQIFSEIFVLKSICFRTIKRWIVIAVALCFFFHKNAVHAFNDIMNEVSHTFVLKPERIDNKTKVSPKFAENFISRLKAM